MGRQTRNSGFDRANGPTTRGEFEAALEDLVRAAAANDVGVKGGFGLRHPDSDAPDWAIEITRLRKRGIEATESGRPGSDRSGKDHE